MASSGLLQELLSLPDHAAQRALLSRRAAHSPSHFDDDLMEGLKQETDQLVRADLDACRQMCALMLYAAELSGDPRHRALGLLALANYHLIGCSACEQAIDLYEQAAAIYGDCGETVRQARSQIGKVGALARMGRYQEALAAAAWAEPILDEPDHWEPHAGLLLNCGYIHSLLGDERASLDFFQRARALLERYGSPDSPSLPWIDNSSSIALRNLGRFDEAIEACQRAHDDLLRLGQVVEAARARQAMGVIYFLLGRYNEALQAFDRARSVFAEDGRHRDAVLVDLMVCDCLLQLRRFGDVLARSETIATTFAALGTPTEQAQALLNRAVAYAGLGRHDEAQETLSRASQIFQHEGSLVWGANVDLERAALHRLQHRAADALEAARACAAVYAQRGLVLKETQAQLLMAWALAELERIDEALPVASAALRFAEERDVPALTYQACHLLGRLAQRRGQAGSAAQWYERALDALERVRGRIMVEYRAAFVEDKRAPYEDAIALALDSDYAERALRIAERCKSRALLDLLEHHLDVGVRPRSGRDIALVRELDDLRLKRDRLHHLWEGRSELLDQGWSADEAGRHRAAEELLRTEHQITQLWHTMLVRDADYARDAALWRVQVELPQQQLAAGMLLVEYCVVHGELVVFMVDRDGIRAQRLATPPEQVARLIDLLWLNLNTVPRGHKSHGAQGLTQAQHLLQRLFQSLIAPWQEQLAGYRGVIIVPHGALHYLPFHALYDGSRYLVQRLEVSYLPSASLLRHCQRPRDFGEAALVVGHANGGLVPHALREARAIAELLRVTPLIAQQARVARVRERLNGCGLIHLATHGEFRGDNPLFSGLALADGWLTTLDVFGLDLHASLVTLSACETARSRLGGGDELLGLMRAFLHSGAASLLMSLWTVDDRSTEHLMTTFYRALASGATKAAALRQALCQVIASEAEEGATDWRHPYYWAPFVLVGSTGALRQG